MSTTTTVPLHLGTQSLVLVIRDTADTIGLVCNLCQKFFVPRLTSRITRKTTGHRCLRWKSPLIRQQVWTFYEGVTQSQQFRHSFWNCLSCPSTFLLKIKLNVDQCPLIIDKSWSFRIIYLINNRMEVEELLALLSTLGGAFSCLGEINSQAALTAGKIAMRQLSLSKSTGDPNLVIRCFLYQVYSLCQRGLKRKAMKVMRDIIHPFICNLKETNSCDDTLIKMYGAARHRIIFLNEFEKIRKKEQSMEQKG